jgi:predicted extracellular nuclease
MLDTLHKEGYLGKVAADQIVMTPNSATVIPLPQLLSEMSKISGADEVGVQEERGQSFTENVQEQIDTDAAGDNKKIAQNLLIQAMLLEKEAEKKRSEAVRFDPSLTEKAEKPAKKGRGRPAGTTAKAMAARAKAAATE